jgi:hypothetical protein
MNPDEEKQAAATLLTAMNNLSLDPAATVRPTLNEPPPIQHLDVQPKSHEQPTAFFMKPKLADPPKFSGHYNENVISFVDSMTLYLAITKPPANTWVACTVMQLTGVASVWAKKTILPSLISDDPRVQATCTWETFKKDIFTRFQPVEANRQAREELYSLSQWACKSQNSVQEYCSKFTEVVERITDMNEADQIQHFIRGLKTKTREKVEDVDPVPNTLDQAMSLAVRKDYQITRQLKSSNQPPPFRGRQVSAPRTFHPNQSTVQSVPMVLGNIESYNYEQDNENAGNDVSVSYVNSSGNSRPWYSGKLKEHPGLKERLIRDGRCLFCREKGHVQESCSKFIEVKKKEQSKNY